MPATTSHKHRGNIIIVGTKYYFRQIVPAELRGRFCVSVKPVFVLIFFALSCPARLSVFCNTLPHLTSHKFSRKLSQLSV